MINNITSSEVNCSPGGPGQAVDAAGNPIDVNAMNVEAINGYLKNHKIEKTFYTKEPSSFSSNGWGINYHLIRDWANWAGGAQSGEG